MYLRGGLTPHFTGDNGVHTYLSLYISISLYRYISISLYLYLYISISIYISIYLYLSISIYIYLYLSISIISTIYLSIYLPSYSILSYPILFPTETCRNMTSTGTPPPRRAVTCTPWAASRCCSRRGWCRWGEALGEPRMAHRSFPKDSPKDGQNSMVYGGYSELGHGG